MATEDPHNWTLEKLRRKRDQAWDMAGLARHDRDIADEQRHTADARLYSNIICERHSDGTG